MQFGITEDSIDNTDLNNAMEMYKQETALEYWDT